MNMKALHALDYYRGLPNSIYVLFVSRIINSMGAFVRPFLAIFLTLNMGIGPAQAGLIGTIAILVYAPGSAIGGILADRVGRKKTLITFRFLAAACYVPCAFLGNSMLIPIFLIMSAFISGIADPSSNCMVADLTNEKNRKQAFSLLYLGINMGFSIGPMIAGFLYTNYIEWIFLGDAITSFGSIILIHRYVKETMPDLSCIDEYGIRKDSDERPEEGAFSQVLRRRPLLIYFAFINMLLWFVLSQCNFTLPLQVNELFGTSDGPRLFGILMSINGLVVVMMTLFLTKLTQTLKPIINISISGILCAIGFGMLYFSSDFRIFMLSTAIWTMGEILNATNSGVYIANHTPMSHRGRFNAVINLIGGTGISLNPLLMGIYISAFSLRMVWPLVVALSIVGTVLMYALYLLEKRKVY